MPAGAGEATISLPAGFLTAARARRHAHLARMPAKRGMKLVIF